MRILKALKNKLEKCKFITTVHGYYLSRSVGGIVRAFECTYQVHQSNRLYICSKEDYTNFYSHKNYDVVKQTKKEVAFLIPVMYHSDNDGRHIMNLKEEEKIKLAESYHPTNSNHYEDNEYSVTYSEHVKMKKFMRTEYQIKYTPYEDDDYEFISYDELKKYGIDVPCGYMKNATESIRKKGYVYLRITKYKGVIK